MVVQSYVVIQERNRIMDVVDTEPRWMLAVLRRSGNVTGMERDEHARTCWFPGRPHKECRLGEGSLLAPCHQQERYYSSFTTIPEDIMLDAYVFNLLQRQFSW